MKLENLLKKIGLNETTIQIYLFLLEKDKATILDISRTTKVARTSIYNNLDQLLEWGLVKEISTDTKKFLKAESPENLIHGLHMKEKIAMQAMELLTPIYEKNNSQTKFFQGSNDQYLEEIITNKSKDIKILLSSADKLSLVKIFTEKNKSVKLLTKHKINERELKNPLLLEAKDLKVDIQMDTIICEEKVYFISKNNYFFSIQNHDFLSDQKNYFNLLWHNSDG